MDEAFLTETAAWLTDAEIAGRSEADIVSSFCGRCVAAGMPLSRTAMFIDTLHPVHEGRLYQWDHGAADLRLLEYGRTDPEVLAASGSPPGDNEAVERWRRSPFYQMLQTGEPMFRLRLNATSVEKYSLLQDWLAAGLTDYVAMICRFAPEEIIGEMDGVYLSWATSAAEGIRRSAHRRARASCALTGARVQSGGATTHDPNADGNLSRPRRRSARAQRADHAGHE